MPSSKAKAAPKAGSAAAKSRAKPAPSAAASAKKKAGSLALFGGQQKRTREEISKAAAARRAAVEERKKKREEAKAKREAERQARIAKRLARPPKPPPKPWPAPVQYPDATCFDFGNVRPPLQGEGGNEIHLVEYYKKMPWSVGAKVLPYVDQKSHPVYWQVIVHSPLEYIFSGIMAKHTPMQPKRSGWHDKTAFGWDCQGYVVSRGKDRPQAKGVKWEGGVAAGEVIVMKLQWKWLSFRVPRTGAQSMMEIPVYNYWPWRFMLCFGEAASRVTVLPVPVGSPLEFEDLPKRPPE